MKPILEIKGISKKFKIGRQAEPYLSLRNSLTNIFQNSKSKYEDFWALKDINFNVEHGESIGIIGKNGAGKSTLLKILSKITPPTQGRIISRGRMASLLEVGTGFHPELTGRENVFLNGSILGMKKKEITARFDEIVDFAGTEKFLDTPLKHYSSGMQLRLAFAVAAFLEPEILIIDEVLAVGDAEFQKKCLGKMESVSKSGRTILFVSHNMAAVENLCSKSIFLKGGQVKTVGPSQEVIQQYLSLAEGQLIGHTGELILNSDESEKPLRKVEILCDGRNSSTIYMGCRLEIRVHFKGVAPFESPLLGLVIRDSQNIPMLGINNKHYGATSTHPVSEGYISMTIPYLPLFEGIYQVDVHFGNAFRDIEILRDCFQITVEPLNFNEQGEFPDKRYNKFFIKDVVWRVEEKLP
jgi:lipopolysaccharide transport system ATP-binding protein